MAATRWTTDSIPDLSGRVALVTGGNIGLGFRTSLELARKGAEVFIACRSVDKGEAAAGRILGEVPAARVEVLPLDLLDSGSIRNLAAAFGERRQRLDILVNNAGVVMLDTRRETPAGRELHMATNHLGHFALTGRLFGLLAATQESRVVTVSSGAWRAGTIDLDDLDWTRRSYDKTRAYGDSKYANLLFMLGLQRRFDAAGATAFSLAAHPGLTATERHDEFTGLKALADRIFASPVQEGVLPQLRAATDPSARAGDYYGPRFGIRGGPTRTTLPDKRFPRELIEQLWSRSQELTGVSCP